VNKVLILTTYFAPAAHVGAKRVAKYCKYLAQYGWAPVVITRKTSQFHLLDETLNHNLPPDLDIYRVGAEKKNKPMNESSANQRQRQNPFRELINRIYDFIVFYDFVWIFRAFLLARTLIKEKNIKVVFSTFPNAEPLLVGLLLKMVYKQKWVSEFRDPWVLLHQNYKVPFSQRVLEKQLERMVLKRSDHVVTVGNSFKNVLSGALSRSSRNKVSVIYNGYDADDFVGIDESKKTNEFLITYLGIWGNRRTPEYFLRALGRLFREISSLKMRIMVEFIGEVKFDPELEMEINRIIQEENLDNNVKRIPFMPHRKGLARLKNSDVLLLAVRPSQTGTDNHWMVTSKLFEYLYIGKPILALVPPRGEAAMILKKSKAGMVVEPTDINEIKKRIYELYEQHNRRQLSAKIDFKYVSQFERKRSAEKLAGIFDRIARDNVS
jgi:glycosyltransferase involved in cell wall biosynthesis